MRPPPVWNLWYGDETTQIGTHWQGCMSFIQTNLFCVNLKQHTFKINQDALFYPLINLQEIWSCYAESITYDTKLEKPNRLNMHEITNFENVLIPILVKSFIHVFSFIHHSFFSLHQTTKCLLYEIILPRLLEWIHYDILFNRFVLIYVPSITGFHCVKSIVINV